TSPAKTKGGKPFCCLGATCAMNLPVRTTTGYFSVSTAADPRPDTANLGNPTLSGRTHPALGRAPSKGTGRASRSPVPSVLPGPLRAFLVLVNVVVDVHQLAFFENIIQHG